MTPATYVTTIVVPTLREALAARGDRRLIYLACIAVFHVIDYVAGADEKRTKDLRDELKTIDCTAFEIVQGVCNGAKHAGGARQQWIVPGKEDEFLPFGFGPGCGGWGDGRWDHAGLAVTHDGQEYFLDVPAQRLLLIICQHCAAESPSDNVWLGLSGRDGGDSRRVLKPDLDVPCGPRPLAGSIAVLAFATKPI